VAQPCDRASGWLGRLDTVDRAPNGDVEILDAKARAIDAGPALT